MRYINFKSTDGKIETIEDVRNLSKVEKLKLLNEYNIAYGGGCYLSQRATKQFNQEQ